MPNIQLFVERNWQTTRVACARRRGGDDIAGESEGDLLFTVFFPQFYIFYVQLMLYNFKSTRFWVGLVKLSRFRLANWDFEAIHLQVKLWNVHEAGGCSQGRARRMRILPSGGILVIYILTLNGNLLSDTVEAHYSRRMKRNRHLTCTELLYTFSPWNPPLKTHWKWREMNRLNFMDF